MLPLFFVGIVFFFLLLGSVVFLLCLLTPSSRQYALSAALWCAMWGPCSVALMLFAGVGLIAAGAVSKAGNLGAFYAPNLDSSFGWSYLAIGILITAIAATGVAWIHQWLIKRLTLALFRLYAAAVSGGIGSVLGWCLAWWAVNRGLTVYGWFSVWVGCMLALIAGFGFAAHKGARGLRGQAPTGFTWISQEEYAGS